MAAAGDRGPETIKIGERVPVAVITGPVGVGKSTVLRGADALLIGAGIPHASVELEDIARFWGPKPDQGGTRPDIAYRNLASVWANYRDGGADRLLLSVLMERRSDLRPVCSVIPGADIKVIRLHAPLQLIEERLRPREQTILEQELSAARWWTSRLKGSRFADYVVDNSHRQVREGRKGCLTGARLAQVTRPRPRRKLLAAWVRTCRLYQTSPLGRPGAASGMPAWWFRPEGYSAGPPSFEQVRKPT